MNSGMATGDVSKVGTLSSHDSKQFAADLRAERARWRTFMQRAGITAE